MSFLFVVWFLFLPFVGYHLANIRIILDMRTGREEILILSFDFTLFC